jgi:hypothetical protein
MGFPNPIVNSGPLRIGTQVSEFRVLFEAVRVDSAVWESRCKPVPGRSTAASLRPTLSQTADSTQTAESESRFELRNLRSKN